MLKTTARVDMKKWILFDPSSTNIDNGNTVRGAVCKEVLNSFFTDRNSALTFERAEPSEGIRRNANILKLHHQITAGSVQGASLIGKN